MTQRCSSYQSHKNKACERFYRAMRESEMVAANSSNAVVLSSRLTHQCRKLLCTRLSRQKIQA